MTLESDVRDVLTKHVEPIIKDLLDVFNVATPPPPLPTVPPDETTEVKAPEASTTPEVPTTPVVDAPPSDPNAHTPAPSGSVVETSGTAEPSTGDVNADVPAPSGNVVTDVGTAVKEAETTVSEGEKVADFVKGLAPEALAALKEALKVV